MNADETRIKLQDTQLALAETVVQTHQERAILRATIANLFSRSEAAQIKLDSLQEELEAARGANELLSQLRQKELAQAREESDLLAARCGKLQTAYDEACASLQASRAAYVAVTDSNKQEITRLQHLVSSFIRNDLDANNLAPFTISAEHVGVEVHDSVVYYPRASPGVAAVTMPAERPAELQLTSSYSQKAISFCSAPFNDDPNDEDIRICLLDGTLAQKSAIFATPTQSVLIEKWLAQHNKFIAARSKAPHSAHENQS